MHLKLTHAVMKCKGARREFGAKLKVKKEEWEEIYKKMEEWK